MRRITKVAAIAAIALTGLVATASAASAAVSYDDYRVGHVDKGDVQALFGGNDAAFQQYADNIKFTNLLVTVKDTSWTCTDGSTQHHLFTTNSLRPLDVTQLKTKQGKVTDWTLNGLSKTDYGTTTGVGSDGQRFPSYACPAGSYLTGLNVAQTHSTGVQVSDGSRTFDLPVTPVEVPVEAPTA